MGRTKKSAVKGIISGREVFATGSPRAREGYGARVRAELVIKCVNSLNTFHNPRKRRILT